MSPTAVATLLLRLSDRDMAVLESIRSYRLLSTDLIRRLHFAQGHATIGAASGATMRVLGRLESHGLVARLTRRIGGVRRGSSGIVWQLGATGERLLRTVHGEKRRRRYVEPSADFILHTLAVAQHAIRLHEVAGRGAIELVSVETEPSCWRSFVSPHGTLEWLKPDLAVVTASGDFEDHWFLEIDRATEHPPVVVRKAKTYLRYAATGAHQARHGLFPAVAWVVPDAARQKALEAALSADSSVQPGVFQVVTSDAFEALITGQATAEESAS
ncbi:replication-relaxation family protein [Streptomyces sp. DSM 44917]|uniref:Replication-relaxation family protein n=1 Tax=Streptomyces boetiae TaxID=3075541 RepID=A0ABU2LDK7_9ACTN|nr:replication-relaxation family protein [Streptomyces sp. DSM 44917]MDT0309662.1 replication-relaxation family protein [Streptomyces sp. DSM 44917]